MKPIKSILKGKTYIISPIYEMDACLKEVAKCSQYQHLYKNRSRPIHIIFQTLNKNLSHTILNIIMSVWFIMISRKLRN